LSFNYRVPLEQLDIAKYRSSAYAKETMEQLP